tara:strand:+ start:83 stop:1405 length:1323 start_codon:yes stop_codon:yes gene_type:complete
MGIFYKSDGLKSYHLTGSSEQVVQLSHTTAFRDAGSSQVGSAISSLYGNDGTYTDAIFLSSDGTKLYILYTDFITVNQAGDGNQGYLKQFTLSTAWLLSSINTTPVHTITLPRGNEWSVTGGYSGRQRWSGLEFNSAGTSFHLLRYEDNGGGIGSIESVTFKVNYSLSFAWTLSSSSLTSTTEIAYSSVTGYGGTCSGYHTMSGGEVVLSMGGQFIQLSSISDTTANFTSSLAAGSFFFSTDETLLLQSNVSCGTVDTEIETNYSASSSDTTAPTAPTFLFVSSITQTGFNLTWTASTDNVAVTGYRLYRGAFLYAVLGNVTSTTVTGQTASATNSWTLRAFDAATNLSASSAARSVTQTGSITAFSSSTGHFSQSTACGLLHNQTYYHDGTGSIPVTGDNVYSDSAGTVGLARNHYFYAFGTYHIQTGGTTIDSTDVCF